MNKRQEQAIEELKNWLTDVYNIGREDHPAMREFKRWEVKDHEFFSEVRFTIGSKYDEDTLASVFCRTSGQVFIGKRGGFRAYDNTGKLYRGLHNMWKTYQY